jgi:hypothetical protein
MTVGERLRVKEADAKWRRGDQAFFLSSVNFVSKNTDAQI